MKKIAFIIQHLTNGGAERTISNLSMLLNGTYDIYLIVFDGEAITYPYDATLLDLKLPPKKGFVNKVINSFRRIAAVRRLKKQYRFDCVISFMFGANIVNVLSGHIGKTVTSARNYMSAYGKGIKAKLREKFVASRSDAVVALSKMVAIDLHDTFGVPERKLTVIYNPCNTDRIRALAEQTCPFEFSQDFYYFVTAGRMVEQKGQWHLLKAFALLKERELDKKIKLIILGSGELNDDLQKLTVQLGVESDVHYAGFCDNPYSYISRSNCFVLSSLFEGLGNVILEAMACKVPVVSYDCLAGPRELIAPETDPKLHATKVEHCSCGILVPLTVDKPNWTVSFTENDRLLSDAMYKIYSEPEIAESITENALEHLKSFSGEHIAGDWMELIK